MRLLNVLIVDDEPFVVDWVANLLELQEDMSLDIYRAYNVSEALDKIDHIRIDILISDIIMPDIDGLQLAQLVIHNWGTCKVILLTAHADFSYVQSAINQGIVSYILKTETDSNILNEIKRTIKLIEHEVSQTKVLEDIRRDRDHYQYQLQRYAFFHWLQNVDRPYEIPKYVEMLGFQDKGAQFCLLIGKLNADEPGETLDDMTFFQVKVVILHYIRDHIARYTMEIDNQRMIWILQPISDSEQRFPSLLRGLLEPVQQFCLDNYHMTISFLLSEMTAEPVDIGYAYATSESLLQCMHAC